MFAVGDRGRGPPSLAAASIPSAKEIGDVEGHDIKNEIRSSDGLTAAVLWWAVRGLAANER